ncbi:type IV pilus modification protein PilV [Pseudoalteromonas sp. NEC-BIFX-2020_002]|uniref:Type IV pilus modification protein PilV n=1 Tax=Pseudoalteromonas neustonica TaxID=1840331 RepID=A0ABU9TZQ3_9GAMM|nr:MULTISPECIES: type IV pilus modification protein PilV [unclassified Pseudoalteromonas]NMR27906.1 type IV pilus modification protein PilV [Pseudoalteromonas sp. NEC-BIFX-2020_015]NNG43884.1 type IV pilus modification protein PilV [Pseudoalteromonas sp. NEC-BIFX-2020_002]
MGSAHPSSLRGFTLIEVLIAFVILSFGLLGAVALQATAKKASFDSMQRAAAVALGNDIIQRMRANDSAGFAGRYNGTFTSDTALNQQRHCYTNTCTAAQIAALDRQQWIRAIQARENTGTLDDATVCINNTAGVGGKANAFSLQVVISWQGREALSAVKAPDDIVCGDANKKRRIVVLESYMYLRTT